MKNDAMADEKSSVFELYEAYNKYRNKYFNRCYNNFKDARDAILDLIKDITYTPKDLLKFYNIGLVKYDVISQNEVVNNIHKTFRSVLVEKLNNHGPDKDDESLVL